MTPPTVSIPTDNGATSTNKMFLVEPDRTEP